jgi:hypothetical protein
MLFSRTSGSYFTIAIQSMSTLVAAQTNCGGGGSFNVEDIR